VHWTPLVLTEVVVFYNKKNSGKILYLNEEIPHLFDEQIMVNMAKDTIEWSQ
jgi:hypothetical protein